MPDRSTLARAVYDVAHITGTFRLRRLLPNGTLKTIGGTGGFIGSLNDGALATDSSIFPVAMAFDSHGEIDVSKGLWNIAPLRRREGPEVVKFEWPVHHFVECGFAGPALV